MLHAATHDPLKFFKGKPEKLFRRRDYYAAKVIGESLEPRITVTENLSIPYVKSLLKVAQDIINGSDPSDKRVTSDDISACAEFLVHLFYRSSQWMGEDFFAGLEKMRVEMEQSGKSMSSVIREDSIELYHNGECIILFSQVNTPTFIIGDCGPFFSSDTELRLDNEAKKRNDPNWVPAQQRIWMALSPQVALGVAMSSSRRESQDILPNTKRSANWVDHFNEICARQSKTIAGVSEKSVRVASQKAWPVY